MKVVLIAMLATGACGPGRTTFARHPSAATAFDRAGSDPKAVEIADRVIAAAGGTERWNQIKQIKWTEEVTTDGKVVFAFEEAWDRWNGRHHGRLRAAGTRTDAVETSHNPTQSTRAGAGDVVVMRKLYEGGGGGAYFDTGQGLKTLAPAETERAVATARERWEFDTAVLCMPFLLEEPGTKLEYVGEAEGEGGRRLDDVKVTFDPRDPNRTASYHVMVNRESNMIERLDIVAAGQPDTKRLAYYLTEWTDVSGLKFATVYQNVGVKGEVVTFKAITAGDPDDSLYVPVVQ